jgi:predicted transcriptional regulator of viral defense system
MRKVFQIDAVKERKLLSKLSKKGLIVRLRRGLYLVPDRIPPGGKWNPTEYMINAYVMKDLKATYQICGPTAFNFYSLEDQIPNAIYLYNDKISGKRIIGGRVFIYIKTKKSRLGAIKTFKTPDGITVKMSSLARTLMDAVYDWSRFNTLPRAYRWIIQQGHEDKNMYNELAEVTIQYGNQATIRRIGYLLERNHVSEDFLERLQQKLSSSMSFIPFVPNKPERGTINKRWKLIVNE